jgi:phosphate uptake regulator
MSNIKKQIDYLIGLEIVESSYGKIVAKDYFNLEEANIENFVKRMDNNIKEMFDELERGVDTGKLTAKQFSEIFDADHDVNKFYLLINKLFIKGAGNPSILKIFNTDVIGLFNNWWLSYNLEHVGDEVKRIARFIKQEGLDSEKSKSVSMVLAKVKEAYNLSISSYYRKDKEISLKVISEKDRMIELAETLSMDKNSTVAKTGEKLKIIIGLLHQINKIILYSIVGV